MKSFQLPPHWRKEEKEAYARSLRFLESIVDASDEMEFQNRTDDLPLLLIRGISNRCYKIDVRRYEYEEWQGNGFLGEINWSIFITGGETKMDVERENEYSVSICLGPDEAGKKLPIGDQIATLALALRSDTDTAMRIPLLDDFLSTPRQTLKGIFQFTQEGIVSEEDFYGPDEIDFILVHDDEESEDDDAEHDDDIIDQDELTEERRELRNYDEWIDRIEEVLPSHDEAMPWHHDEEKIWHIDEKFRKKLD